VALVRAEARLRSFQIEQDFRRTSYEMHRLWVLLSFRNMTAGVTGKARNSIKPQPALYPSSCMLLSTQPSPQTQWSRPGEKVIPLAMVPNIENVGHPLLGSDQRRVSAIQERANDDRVSFILRILPSMTSSSLVIDNAPVPRTRDVHVAFIPHATIRQKNRKRAVAVL
jgi:hypothetical protein